MVEDNMYPVKNRLVRGLYQTLTKQAFTGKRNYPHLSYHVTFSAIKIDCCKSLKPDKRLPDKSFFPYRIGVSVLVMSLIGTLDDAI
ncbi:hypothetical protein L6452_20765 [Arctium lappa]|uniref:Uncharacterized protein n=1 Tax=Arctium lappa TaxID=4217 RepID=A0ACB9BGQ1_ARCLA|nr:hypothetical protein L6452_20765 [Arctium lappa]